MKNSGRHNVMKFGTLIETERLSIQPFQRSNITPEYISWLNDKQTMRYSEQRHKNHTMESSRVYFESMQGDSHWFLAISIKSAVPRHVGNISVFFDLPNGTADISILIGEKISQGQGFGQEAWQSVLARLLAMSSIRKVTAGTMSVNKAMICVARNSGMITEGVKARQFLLDDAEIDLVQFAKFAS